MYVASAAASPRLMHMPPSLVAVILASVGFAGGLGIAVWQAVKVSTHPQNRIVLYSFVFILMFFRFFFA